jgi:GDP-L-fucose synthase
MTHQSILVTGATGFLGRHVVPLLERTFPDRRIVAVGSEAADLSRLDQTIELIQKTKPDCVVHLAQYGGGPAFTARWTADCLFQNAAMTLNLYEAAAQNGVKKIVYTMPSASYPARLLSPVSESQIWSGYNGVDSAGYSLGKRIGSAAADVYRWQYGMESSVLILGDIYGEYANLRPEEATIVARVMRGMHEAALAGSRTLSLSASAHAPRDLVYAGDVAELIPWFIENDHHTPVNVSQGVGHTIEDLIDAVRAAIGVQVKVDIDDGNEVVPHILDVTALGELGLTCPTPLKTGVKRMAKWYLDNLDDPKPGFRA